MKTAYSPLTPKIAVAICLLMASCHSKKKEESGQKEDKPAIVDVVVAYPESISNILEANGSIVANEYVELHPEVSGRLTYLNVPEGATIAQGTVIAKIFDGDLQAQLNKSKVLLELAQKTEQRLGKLLAINGVNQADYDLALNQVNSLKADIAYTQTLIDKTVLKAPFTGVMGLRKVSPGAYITPLTLIASIQQVSVLKVDFTLPEEYSGSIRKGSVVEVEVDGAVKTRCKATVVAVEPQINLTTRNLQVRALLSKCNANPGTFVKVYVNNGSGKNSIMIPTNAIIPDDKNKKLVVIKNGQATFKDVETGIRNEEYVEIKSGISTGDTVVVGGVLFARPGKPVKIRKVERSDK
ncbi:efflux RND transporter periplasmic adaptor subunit [Flectobacillus major]|jgi:membrane fusion protein (multidrug efflux system)|uniref:efflux RND transporter periplasmic adaptor subunit n=1 Tax=Flectobacillus major TaxID=103 RepID=UPI000478A04B|nr:efflux RND transporter periplasmic adaptor subunit [Flectobacillus major]